MLTITKSALPVVHEPQRRNSHKLREGRCAKHGMETLLVWVVDWGKQRQMLHAQLKGASKARDLARFMRVG
jgi:chemotaxis receptor (MCP) glutamine deamidase CheD